jgi:hypothetical protein
MTTGGVNSSLENGSVRSSLLFGGIDLRWPIGFFIVALIAGCWALAGSPLLPPVLPNSFSTSF